MNRSTQGAVEIKEKLLLFPVKDIQRPAEYIRFFFSLPPSVLVFLRQKDGFRANFSHKLARFL